MSISRQVAEYSGGVPTLNQIARALGGIVSGGQVLAPAPGHGPKDRGLSVRLDASSPGGFLVHLFNGGNPLAAKDYVRGKLGLPLFKPNGGNAAGKGATRRANSPRGDSGKAIRSLDDDARRIRAANAIWEQAGPIPGTLAEYYLREHRKLTPFEDFSHVIRFHSRCPWRVDDTTIHVPAMIAAMRQIDGDALTAVQRTRLGPDGNKIERRMLGKASGAAIKIDRDENVTYGLATGEGLETCLAARQLGFHPVWALGSAGAIGAFPVAALIDCITLLAETDGSGANERAIEACGDRWLAAGREIIVAEPLFGGDMNDATRGDPR